MKVKCINDSNRPNDIPTSKWIIKDKVYTVINEYSDTVNGHKGYELSEVAPDPPYYGYSAHRFRELDSLEALQYAEQEIAERETVEL